MLATCLQVGLRQASMHSSLLMIGLVPCFVAGAACCHHCTLDPSHGLAVPCERMQQFSTGCIACVSLRASAGVHLMHAVQGR